MWVNKTIQLNRGPGLQHRMHEPQGTSKSPSTILLYIIGLTFESPTLRFTELLSF